MVAVRPPEYLPRLAYMALVDRADRFVVADTFQYSRQSFQNRARLRTPDGWMWVSVPVGGGQHGRSAAAVEIEGDPYWARKHWRAFTYNYRTTPFFEFFEHRFRALFEHPWTRLADLTSATVVLLHELLGLATPLVRASVLDGVPDTLSRVLRAVDAAPLLSPAAAAAYDAARVDDVRVFHYDEPRYRQNFDGFEPGLSAVDLLFNYGPEARAILRQGARTELAAPRA